MNGLGSAHPESLTSKAIGALFLGAFIMGTTELVAVGLVPDYAERADISVEAAGGAVGFYALGMFLVGPILALATSKIRTKPVMIGACAAFIVGCAVAVTPWAPALFAGRLLSGAAQGVFMASSFQMIAATAPPARVGPLVARVLAGISLAAAVGLPAGTEIGSRLGVATVTWLSAGAAGLVLLGVLLWTPHAETEGGLTVSEEVTTLRNSGVLLRLLGLVLAFAATFTLVTQMAAFTEARAEDSLLWVLIGFGIGAVTGTFTGGHLVQRERIALPTLALALPLILLILLIAASAWVLVLGAALLALVAFATIPLVQTHVATQSSGRLLPALPASAINGGITIGSVLAGRSLGDGEDQLVVIALVPAVATFLAMTLATRTSRRATAQQTLQQKS